MVLKKEEGNKKLEERCQELINQNDKLNKKVVGQMALQGTRHMIWVEIIKEAKVPNLTYLDNMELIVLAHETVIAALPGSE